MNRVGMPDLAGLPRQVERVDRDAVPAQPRAGIERLEAERLGRWRRAITSHTSMPIACEHHLHLVDQRDVHRAVDVLQQLRRLGDLRAADRDDLLDRLAVERRRQLAADRVDPADELGDRLRVVILAARVFALGRVGEVEIARRTSGPCASNCGSMISRVVPRIGASIRARPAAPCRSVLAMSSARLLDVRQVRLEVRAQRRGDAADDRVGLAQAGEVGRRVEPARLRPCRVTQSCAEVLEVVLAAVQRVDLPPDRRRSRSRGTRPRGTPRSSGRPTYPRPITPTTAVLFSIFVFSSTSGSSSRPTVSAGRRNVNRTAGASQRTSVPPWRKAGPHPILRRISVNAKNDGAQPTAVPHRPAATAYYSPSASTRCRPALDRTMPHVGSASSGQRAANSS